MRRPSSVPSAISDSASLCVSANTSGSSWRTPARWSMSKKRRWRPVAGARSKNFGRRAGGPPWGFVVVNPHGVGHDFQHDPEPRLAGGRRERAELLLPAELLRD